MHELGHNLDLAHGGWNSTPNCMPDYPSVMNYLYQTRGLTDAGGNEHIDYSYGLELPMSEDFLSSAFPMGLQNYRVRYFGPFNNTTNSEGQAAQAHCDGTLLNNGEAPYIRLEGAAVSTPDWSNGTILPLGKIITSGLDINYDGNVGQTFFDQPDWISLNLQQVGARPNTNGLSLNVGIADLGIADLGIADLGIADLGIADLGIADLGIADLGQDALGDEDYISHILSGLDPPPSPSQGCPTCGLTAVNQINGNVLNWTAPGTATVLQYNIYRCNASAGACAPLPPALSNTGSVSPAPTTYTDTVNDFVDAGTSCPALSTCYNTTYTYYVTAVASAAGKNVESGPSNKASSLVTHLFVIANSQPAITYGNPAPAPPPFTIYGNVSGSLPGSSVSCTYSTMPPINAGTYTITCMGPATTSATDGVTYNSVYNVSGTTYTPGSLTINPVRSQ